VHIQGLQRALTNLFPSKRRPFALLTSSRKSVPSSRWSLFLLDGALFHVVCNARSVSFAPTAGLPEHITSAKKEGGSSDSTSTWTIYFSAAAVVTAFKFVSQPTIRDAIATYCQRYKKEEETLSVVLDGHPVKSSDRDDLIDDGTKLYVVYQGPAHSGSPLSDVSTLLGTVVSTSS